MVPEIALRLASPTDLAEIIAITDAAYSKYIPRIGRKPKPMTADYSPLIEAGQLWLASVAHGVCGVIVLQPQSDSLLIYSIAVAPAFQGMGVGRRLLTWAESEAMRQGFATVTLYTNEKMVENIALYQRIGYREYKRADTNGFQVVYMSKTLCQPEGGEEVGQADE